MDIFEELSEIKDLIDSAYLIEAVRKEVHSVSLGKTIVMGGKHAESKCAGSSKYDVVVFYDGKEQEAMTRRIKGSIPNIEIENFNNVIDGVLGIKFSRRGK